jgi:putative transposase
MRNAILTNKQIYHVYNRGVDKRDIFLNRRDYQRFSDGLVVFNDVRDLLGDHFNDRIGGENRKQLVNIIAYCLMPNHFHLLLEQIRDDGITHFMRKMTTSYAMYFNKKNGRSGALIQGVFKRSNIASNARLLEMSRYIHTNPWKILSKKHEDDLTSYQWSSLPDYLGAENIAPIVSNKDIILDQFKTTVDYRNYILGRT